jgi:hypothetical protein
MYPQCRKALNDDLAYMGELQYDENGMLSFYSFMHVYMIITRHAKEQFIKELRKTVDKRRRAFKNKAWKEYEEIVWFELAVEKIKYQDVQLVVLQRLEI